LPDSPTRRPQGGKRRKALKGHGEKIYSKKNPVEDTVNASFH
jgi:hypothetical protein